jgi:hypothetical protein|tara:strand:- start:399 stop:575 length:177 start_codon:yes stop_codon:yes gene_type:complete
MKTRQEMVYDFMVALAGNSNTQALIPSDILEDDMADYEAHEIIYYIACRLADRYLGSL